MPDPRIIRFESPLLRQLQPSVRERSVDLLHFGTRAANILERQGINSIGDLVDAARRGLALPHAGIKSIAEIEEALNSLSLSIGRNRRVDWLRYAANRRFLILPAKESARRSMHQFVRNLPAAMEAAVESACGPHGKVLFQRCLLGHDFGAATLEQTGRSLGFSKQAASLTKEKVLGILRGTIFDDNYRACRFRFRPAFLAPLRDLKGALDKTRGRAFPYARWAQILAQTWRVAATEVAPVENLLFIIFGYQVVRPTGPQIEAIVLPRGRNVMPLRSAIADTARLLNREFPSGLSKLQLFRELRRSKGNAALILPEIPVLVKAISGVEGIGQKAKIRARPHNISRMTDQLECILREKGVAIHAEQLALEIRRYKARAGSIRSARNVGAAMSGDKRFNVVARSGVWILSEWNHIETRTVAEIAADLIRQKARPMTEAELFEQISNLRSVKKGSIMTLLREDGRFYRTAPLTWDLK